MLKINVLGACLLSFSFFAFSSQNSATELANLKSAQIVLIPKPKPVAKPANVIPTQVAAPAFIPKKASSYRERFYEGMNYCVDSLKAHPYIAVAVVALCASGYAYKKGYFDALLAKLGIQQDDSEALAQEVMQN